MNVPEILITVGLTVAAAVAIAYTTVKLQARHRERALFRALQSEIEYNRLRLDNLVAEWSLWEREKSDYRPQAPILFAEAYEALRLSGELLRLPEGVRNKLSTTYSLIAIYNFRMNEARLDYFQALLHDENAQDRINRIIKNIQILENELAKEVQKPNKRSDYEQQRKDLLQRYIMSQAPLFFTFGLFSIYANYLGKPSVAVQILLIAVGMIFIVWAFILSIVGLNCKMPRTLEGVSEKIKGFMSMREKSDVTVYVVTVVVFGVGLATTWDALSRTGIGATLRWVILVIGVALMIVLFVDYILRVVRPLTTKSKTKNGSETQNHGA